MKSMTLTTADNCNNPSRILDVWHHDGLDDVEAYDVATIAFH